MDIFELLYKPYDDEIKTFGKHWCGPTNYEQGTEHLVATYDAQDSIDAQTAEVYCCAFPARFYIIRAFGSNNKKPFTLCTGSGFYMCSLAVNIAEAISSGMLSLEQ